MNAFHIRLATNQDLEEIARLYSVLLEEEVDPLKSQSAFEEIESSNNTFLFVAEVGEKVVGTLQATKCLGVGFSGKSFLTVEYFIVDEDYRHNGIGTALLKQVDLLAQENDCAFCHLVSSTQRKEAHRLYKNAGYGDDVVGFRKSY